jgi:pSer/pThr/pTyr-binding forkhead associated (FHA) protein
VSAVDRFLDFLFGIRWWQWLLGMGSLAGLYYVLAAFVLPFFKGVQEEHVEETERKKQEEEERRREAARQEREAQRREYLKAIPSGPVEAPGLPAATLRVRGRVVRVPQDAELTFGTQRGVGVQIMSRGISRRHAKIRPEPRGYVLYDLMSETGTQVNGQRVRSHTLLDGDRVQIGPVEVRFQLGPPPKDA